MLPNQGMPSACYVRRGAWLAFWGPWQAGPAGGGTAMCEMGCDVRISHACVVPVRLRASTERWGRQCASDGWRRLHPVLLQDRLLSRLLDFVALSILVSLNPSLALPRTEHAQGVEIWKACSRTIRSLLCTMMALVSDWYMHDDGVRYNAPVLEQHA